MTLLLGFAAVAWFWTSDRMSGMEAMPGMDLGGVGFFRVEVGEQRIPAVGGCFGVEGGLFERPRQGGFAGLVGVDSYVIVTDTIVGGRPVWTSFGPGPTDGIKLILGRHGEFAPDPDMEKYALSFNTGGFLRRVR